MVKDWTIRRIILEYKVSNKYTIDCNEFWGKQTGMWNTLPDIFSVDVKNKQFLPLPSSIIDPVLKIIYVFNNREYIYVTKNLEYTWPPKKLDGMKFNLPYKNVVLLDESGAPVKNITDQIIKYAGPKYDFHGAQVPLIDMIDKPFTKIRVTNIMNQQVTHQL